MIEQGIDYSAIAAIVPLVAITISQAKAILNRDDHRCVFVSQHDCHGKLTIHHINGKEDEPENLATVCHEAHWGNLHNGATIEEKLRWENELTAVTREKTTLALENGWQFPDK